jgi:trk system potassium uptake protein TrkH
MATPPAHSSRDPVAHRRGVRGGLRLRALADALLALGAAWSGALRDGFHVPPAPEWVLIAMQSGLLVLLAIGLSSVHADGHPRSWREMAGAWLQAFLPPMFRRERLPPAPPTGLDAFILGLLPLASAALALAGLSRTALGFLDAAALLAALLAIARLGLHLFRRINAPQLLLPATFVLLILSGTFLLKLPRAAGDAEISWIDSLFTATSAVCVTGLSVRSTAEGFSPGGQAVIALLIQLGGLGIVVFGATFAALLRGSLSLREHVTVRDMLEHNSVADLRRFALRVVGVTLLLQLIGALLMLPFWQSAGDSPLAPAQRVWLSTFHSISAFCNAGFDITGDSLVPYRRSILPGLTVSALIILGGIGFPVIFDVLRWTGGTIRHRMGRSLAPARLSLHASLTVKATVILLTSGAVLVFIAQIDRPTGGGASSGITGRAADAWFMSVTARTAGFNTMPMDELSPASSISLMALMCIGGSPGSMAGGFKTTTLVVLFLGVLATIRGRAETEAGNRSIPENLVRKAGAVALCMAGLVLTATILLCITQPRLDPFKLLFESISAATTTGLSLGVTSELSPAGKLVLVLTMFLGRVGPLTLLGVLLIRRPPARAYLFPRETVTLG